MSKRLSPEQWWHGLLTGENPALPVRHFRHFLKLIPAGPRCKFCNAPYHGVGAPIMRALGKGPSRLTPQLCRQCFDYASQYIGGAEVELTMLFADIRGSTPLAEKMSPSAYSQLISRFFAIASELLIQSDALVDRLVGDQVIGMYAPGFAGPNHRQMAIDAARGLLRATGHDSPEGPWIPVGIGVHTGVAFSAQSDRVEWRPTSPFWATRPTLLHDCLRRLARVRSFSARMLLSRS